MISSKRLSRLETSQQEIRRQLDTIVTALITSEPRAAIAAEAFDGLRRNVAFAAQERRRQLIQLVTFADAIERGATLDTLRALSEQWCAEAGVVRYHDLKAKPDWFTVVDGYGDGHGDGADLEVVEPAWVDAATNVLLRQGTARRRPAAAPAPDRAPSQRQPPTAPQSVTAAVASVEPAASAEPAVPVEPVEPAASAEPAVPVEPVEPAASEPAIAAEDAGPASRSTRAKEDR